MNITNREFEYPARKERVVTFSGSEKAWTSEGGALCIGYDFGAVGRSAKVIYAPGTWDRAERMGDDEQAGA